ncbi:MAG: hypothetical protein GXP54_03060 [Deltaproteobacteria bacterium]|nr:hypothetical protein [Deltaproteobacteria bacterium]
MRSLLVAAATLVVSVAASFGCGGGSGPVKPYTLAKVQAEPATGQAGKTLSAAPVIEARDAGGGPVAGLTVSLDVEAGGGSLASAMVVTGEDGKALINWTLGKAPVPNRLRASINAGTPDESAVTFDVQGVLDTPVTPEFFADVNAFMADNGIEGSTEDLAFTDDGGLLMGVKGGLLSVAPDGTVTALELTGDPIGTALGIAVDKDGNIWVADNTGKALRKVDAKGKVETVLENDGNSDLEAPNYVAVGPSGDIYLSDPCVGEIIRWDPVQGKVVARLSFDLKTEGGPNGFAFNAAGDRMFILTENTGVLCGQGDVDMKAPLAGLFSVEIKENGFGERDAVATGIGLFGDGMAFDSEGNLYVIIDRLLEGTFVLEDSAIWVLPEGGKELFRFASLEDPQHDGIMANVAFGSGDFGAGTLYIALLSMPPFSPADKRGLMAVDVGIGGQPLFR